MKPLNAQPSFNELSKPIKQQPVIMSSGLKKAYKSRSLVVDLDSDNELDMEFGYDDEMPKRDLDDLVARSEKSGHRSARSEKCGPRSTSSKGSTTSSQYKRRKF